MKPPPARKSTNRLTLTLFRSLMGAYRCQRTPAPTALQRARCRDLWCCLVSRSSSNPQGRYPEVDDAPQHFWAICGLVELMTSVGRDRVPNKPDGLPTGVLAAMATKVVHRKRSSLIPILDNEPIFGLYLGTPKAQEAAGESTQAFREERARRDPKRPTSRSQPRGVGTERT
jgi:hypothetical protein